MLMTFFYNRATFGLVKTFKFNTQPQAPALAGILSDSANAIIVQLGLLLSV